MTQLRQVETELESLGARVVIVTFEADWVVRAYVKQMQLTWPILSDPDRQLYRAYGIDNARWRDLLGPATLRSYARLMARGKRPRWSGANVSQRGGDVVIDPNGIVRLVYVGTGPADRPSVPSLLTCMRGD